MLRLVLCLQAGLVGLVAMRNGLMEFGWPGLVALALVLVAISNPGVPTLLLAVWAGLGLEVMAWRYQLVTEVIDALKKRFDVTIEEVETAKEAVEFKVPRVLREPV